MYIEMRRTSAFQSFASASRDAVFAHWEYHWMPWVLMPRNWTCWPAWLHSFTPQTFSWPLTAAGEPGGSAAAETSPAAAAELPATTPVNGSTTAAASATTDFCQAIQRLLSDCWRRIS